MEISTDTTTAAATLDGVAEGRAPDRTRERLAEVRRIVGGGLAHVEVEIARAAGEGAAPATDSAAHLIAGGGKRIRPAVALLAAACTGGLGERSLEVAVIAELLHLATLLHDDVIDDAPERRGQKTSRLLWGNGISVLAGDLMLVHALERAQRLGCAETSSEMIETLRALVDGEIVQMRGRTRIDASLETYDRIVRGKTASLFRWAMRAGARTSGATAGRVELLGKVGEHLGVAYQVIDDVLDVDGDPSATGKALFTDVVEGKLSLPLLLHVRDVPAALGLVERVRAGDPAAARDLAAAVRGSSVCREARDKARGEASAARALLADLPPTQARDLLAGLAADMVGRAA